jgi:16S rRNA (cytosine1402-N4)-methyltransferase
LDRDPAALERAAQCLAGLPARFIHADFRHLPAVLAELDVGPVHGILFDLGLSSDQLADESRGFSFDSSGTLDLRFDPTEGEPAWRLVERLRSDQLADVIFRYGEERFARRIAARIVETRARSPIRTAGQLAALIRRCVPRARHHAIDPATRTFQAFRIAVNEELQSLETALSVVPDCLLPHGRLAVISFHSLEDRRVKHAFREDSRFVVLTKKPIRPNEAEVRRNSRSRSARLRVAERALLANAVSD